jgi:hypothetical protein
VEVRQGRRGRELCTSADAKFAHAWWRRWPPMQRTSRLGQLGRIATRS